MHIYYLIQPFHVVQRYDIVISSYLIASHKSEETIILLVYVQTVFSHSIDPL